MSRTLGAGLLSAALVFGLAPARANAHGPTHGGHAGGGHHVSPAPVAAHSGGFQHSAPPVFHYPTTPAPTAGGTAMSGPRSGGIGYRPPQGANFAPAVPSPAVLKLGGPGSAVTHVGGASVQSAVVSAKGTQGPIITNQQQQTFGTYTIPRAAPARPVAAPTSTVARPAVDAPSVTRVGGPAVQSATVIANGTKGPIIINQEQQVFNTYVSRPYGRAWGGATTGLAGSTGSMAAMTAGGTSGLSGSSSPVGLGLTSLGNWVGPSYGSGGNMYLPASGYLPASSGAYGRMLTGGTSVPMNLTPAQAALQTAQLQLHHFVEQTHQAGAVAEAMGPLENDLAQMLSAGHDQTNVRMQALQSALTHLNTLREGQALPGDGQAYAHGLHERLQELAMLAGVQPFAQP